MTAHSSAAVLLLSCALLLLAPGAARSEGADLPVFYLTYDSSLDSEETVDQLEQSAFRHTVRLRIKEKFSDVLTTNLLTAFSRKEYLLESGSYSYVYLNPYATIDLTERIRWYQGFRSKWIFYDEPGSDGESKDFTSLYFDTRLIFKAMDQIKITPSVKGTYDVFENEEKSRQTYAFGLRIDSRLENVRLSGKYRAVNRFPMQPESDVARRFNNEFGASLSWDPNR
jgi:hypothetical protein